MDLTIKYAEMNALTLAGWVLLATLAGLAARQIVRGKPLLGLWSDMVIALVGVFALGAAMRAVNFDLSKQVLVALPEPASPTAIWIDVFITAFVGALVLRLLLRIVKQ